MNVTFFTAANDVPQHINRGLTWTLTTLLVACIIVCGISWYKRWQLPTITSAMLGLWFFAGTLLCCTLDNSFVSDWLSSGGMIGTIGAVITSLYLTFLQSEKEKINALKSDVNELIRNLETFFIQIIKCENEFSTAKNKYDDNGRRIFMNNRVDDYTIAKEQFKLAVRQCSLWLSIQEVNHKNINQKIKSLESELKEILDHDLAKRESIEIIKDFIKNIREILNND